MRRRGHARLVPGLWPEAALLAGAPEGTTPDPSDLRRRLRPTDARPIEAGDLLVFGPGLGAGTTTDRAALAFALAGVGAILTPRADAAFRDACLHAGIPLLAVKGLADAVGDGDDLTVDFANGTVENVTRRRMLMADPLSAPELRLLRVAPSLAWYGLQPGQPDPDVVETVAAPPNDY